MSSETDYNIFKSSKKSTQIIDQIVRNKIYKSKYWREDLFAANEETILEKAFNLKYVAGTFGKLQQPSEFLCLILKLLQIKPDIEIILSFIENKQNKYITVLGLFYLRLIGSFQNIYLILENFYSDFRKIIYRNQNGNYEITYIDEIVDWLLNEEIVFSVKLPRISKRYILEKENQISSRKSELDKELQEYGILDDFNQEKNSDNENKLTETKHENNDKNFDLNKKDYKSVFSNQKDNKYPLTNNFDAKKKLDEDNDEYWLELRKRANID
jgi:pre-mRNA-splicing factor 38A